MNTTLIGLASVIFGTRGIGMRPGALARATMALLLLTSWGAASAQGEEQRLQHVRPMAFEANRGQADEAVKFLARGVGYTVFLTSSDAVLSLRDGRSGRAVVRATPVGASATARIVADGELPGVVNYVGRAPGAAPISAPTYARVRYVDLYPGVDLVYYGRPRQLEYDFVLAPGADPDQIALAFDGADRVEIDAGGDLVLHTAAGDLRQPRPIVYQEIDGTRRPVVGDYVLDGEGRVKIRLGTYDASHALVIDPVLAYSTYLGGSNEESDWLWGAVFGIAVDPAGNTYVTGSTTSVDFPTTPGAYGTLSGDQDAFVTKFSPTGAVVYSTYLGGPCSDIGNAIAVDAAGNAYITGRAHDLCFFGEASSGALVAKLGPTGTLLYALVFGGQLVDTSAGTAIAVDAAGHAYVTGNTSSVDFPTTPGAYRTESCPDIYIRGYSDGFVAKVSADGGSLVFSTFLCGNGTDFPSGIALDPAGNIYVAGTTGSGDFPTVNPLQPVSHTNPFGSTGFLSKLSADGTHLIYSTYLGGSINDAINGLAVDGQGNAYVTGVTTSLDFPTTPGVLQPQRGNVFCLDQFCTDAFVSKINAAGNALVYSTYLYGEGDDSGSGIAVDAAGNAYVVGTTSSLFFPIADAFQPTSKVRGPSDAFVAKLNPDGTRIVYSSYLGGSGGASPSTGGDDGSAIAIDAAGNAYVAGFTKSYDFPTTPGAFRTTIGGGTCDYFGGPCGDAFVAKITAGGPGPVAATRVGVTPTETVPGGLITATWAGVQVPTTDDFLLLFALGSGSETYVAYWPTGGAAAGTMTFTLPAGLAFGTYEIRLLSTDPDFYNLPEAVARTQPIHVGLVAPAAADLVVASIATTPAQPAAGQPVAVTVTVKNQGNLAAGPFSADFYKDRAAAPGPGIIGDVRCAIAALAAGASTQCTGTVTYTAAGTFSAWAQVDTAQAVAESSEANNVSGPRTMTVAAAAGPDLVVTSVGNPPASAAPGKAFAITDTVKNQGATTAAQSTTRFYLSLDAAKDAGDTLLTGSRAVAALAAGAQSAGTTTVTIPLAAPAGTYHVLACADDTQVVAEASDANNCRAAAATIVVGRPDLVETAVSNPPTAARPGTSFAVTDTVRNQGTMASSGSTIRYYLSADAQKSPDDRLLTGSRSVPTLAPGAASTQTVTVTIPPATPPGTYGLLACADDTKLVAESDEGNNCLASGSTITVALPDLVQQTVSSSGGPFRRGTAFTVSDTVVNDSRVGTPSSATTKYYLSTDNVRNTGDILLTGARTVPILAPFASSSAAIAVTIPSATLPGTYVLLACADDTKVIAESNDTNNCRASGTAVVVAP